MCRSLTERKLAFLFLYRYVVPYRDEKRATIMWSIRHLIYTIKSMSLNSKENWRRNLVPVRDDISVEKQKRLTPFRSGTACEIMTVSILSISMTFPLQQSKTITMLIKMPWKGRDKNDKVLPTTLYISIKKIPLAAAVIKKLNGMLHNVDFVTKNQRH
jgi:hypothetical protein